MASSSAPLRLRLRQPKMDSTYFDKAFQTDNLVFRALEDDPFNRDFFRKIQQSPGVFAVSDTSLLRPQSRDTISKDYRWLMDEAPLAVKICYSREPESLGWGSKAPDSTSAERISISREPKPIGVLVLRDGGCGQTYFYHQHRNLELFIQIAKPYQNMGLGKEAINWALDWAFKQAGMHTVSLRVHEYNEHARHVYEKLGFKLGGKERERLFHDGKWWDMYLYSMTEQDWKDLRGCGKDNDANGGA